MDSYCGRHGRLSTGDFQRAQASCLGPASQLTEEQVLLFGKRSIVVTGEPIILNSSFPAWGRCPTVPSDGTERTSTGSPTHNHLTRT
jgi:hypothetical protein